MTTPLPPADLRARVLARAEAEPVAPRAAATWTRVLAVGAALGVSYGLLMSIGGPGAYGRSQAYTVVLTALWGLVGVLGAWAGVARGRSMLGRPASWRLAVFVLTPVALVATALLAGALWPPPYKAADLDKHLVCVEWSMLMAVAPLVAFAWLRRGSDPVAPRLTGAAIGTAAGAIGAVGIELRCSHATVDHVLLGHVLPVLILAGLGALIAGRVVAVTAEAPAPGPGT
jgi:hypothetical protein